MLALTFWLPAANGQEKSSSKKSSTKSATAKASAAEATAEAPTSAKKDSAKKEPRGRLPQYYSDVVTEEQRTEIYAIQSKHEAEIESLEKQLEAAKSALMEEIEGVLSPSQLKKVREQKEAAGEKRKENSADVPAKKSTKSAASSKS